MALLDFIYEKTGIRINIDDADADQDSQLLITALLVLVARSDGGVSPDESLRMVELLRSRFAIKPGEALNLINRASDELVHHTELDLILKAATERLSLAQKEDLMLMVLKVISADNRKDAAEMKLLVALLEGLGVSEKIMSKVYERYFADR
jgi:uncharacterized tellurite resistance protein B-like protein